MRAGLKVAGAALALGLIGWGAVEAAAPRDPIVQAGTAQKVSAHVTIIPDQSTPQVPNVGFIVGSKAALIVDTGMGERNGKIVLAEAQKAAPGRELYLVTTHFHPEHDLGAHAFPATTKLIRSADQQKDIAEFGLQLAEAFSARSPAAAELLKGATFRKADVTFDREHRLDLGGVTVRIIAMGANHTRGDTVVWVEPDRVLFSGDIAMRPQPAFASPYSTIAHWLASLDALEALKPVLIVPSHGPTGDVGLITGYRAYLTSIRDRTAALKGQGRSADQAVEAVTAELQPRYPDAGRLGGAVRAAYAEAR